MHECINCTVGPSVQPLWDRLPALYASVWSLLVPPGNSLRWPAETYSLHKLTLVPDGVTSYPHLLQPYNTHMLHWFGNCTDGSCFCYSDDKVETSLQAVNYLVLHWEHRCRNFGTISTVVLLGRAIWSRTLKRDNFTEVSVVKFGLFIQQWYRNYIYWCLHRLLNISSHPSWNVCSMKRVFLCFVFKINIF
jgi:hypothetical protein